MVAGRPLWSLAGRASEVAWPAGQVTVPASRSILNWVSSRGEVPAEEVLFRAAPLRTTRASFDARGSPVIYAVLASGVPLWTTSWQG